MQALSVSFAILLLCMCVVPAVNVNNESEYHPLVESEIAPYGFMNAYYGWLLTVMP